ncbi:unnamed protein product [Acanthoscelides obtectus]|uniref:Uncharacterized protein n=1 Tax=Acanthoscelides obtectus TaxID=200917 RepID=A0A9P0Q453_ACAOB|nr:unnamed protein product [Acanthoscelides obtectus]CAK1638582.1 hypothetical protein AOBTE_LOCUS10682 [Acanthoscelides obtectus]
MVKKQSNKYQNWDQSDGAATVLEVPDSPTEGSTAPLCYTSLTNRSSKFHFIGSYSYTYGLKVNVVVIISCDFRPLYSNYFE